MPIAYSLWNLLLYFYFFTGKLSARINFPVFPLSV